jgi:FtsP/CotA-like multicopper oxidase with cupredoxin domain
VANRADRAARPQLTQAWRCDVTDVEHWMAHCHLAKHQESGMMFSFKVDE